MNDRFKFRVWDKYTHETLAEQLQFLCFNGCLVDSDGCHHSPDNYIIEQCTGLKDKNGNLIYEGDIIRCSDGNIYNICWSDSAMIIVAVNTTTKIGDAIYKLKRYDDLEIIGNIHENKGE